MIIITFAVTKKYHCPVINLIDGCLRCKTCPVIVRTSLYVKSVCVCEHIKMYI